MSKLSKFKVTWEQAYASARVALVLAQEVIDDLAGWSGSSGNWPLQESSGRVRKALEILDAPAYPDDCQCHRDLSGVTDGLWFGPCEDNRNHRPLCPVAARARARR